ncbi:MAG: sugar phosphate isomerase/epimerase, partial [Bacteroidaceae bacterium]|nr:sugar phosphate isomerase/epimerase [Bacteroidaceae bacterium]
MNKSRRRFLGVSAAALAGITVLPSLTSCAGAEPKAAAPADGKVNSNFAGVHMGCLTYSFRGTPGGLENLLSYCKNAGVSNLELMGNDLEGCLGV